MTGDHAEIDRMAETCKMGSCGVVSGEVLSSYVT